MHTAAFVGNVTGAGMQFKFIISCSFPTSCIERSLYWKKSIRGTDTEPKFRAQVLEDGWALLTAKVECTSLKIPELQYSSLNILPPPLKIPHLSSFNNSVFWCFPMIVSKQVQCNIEILTQFTVRRMPNKGYWMCQLVFFTCG